MSEEVVSLEVAEADFNRALQKQRVRLDEAEMTPVEQRLFATNKEKLVNMIMTGAASVDDDDLVSVVPQLSEAKPFKFGEVTGETYSKADNVAGGFSRNKAMIAQLTGRLPAEINKLKRYDVANLKVVLELFLD